MKALMPATTPPLVTTNLFATPPRPTKRLTVFDQTDPNPVTMARLLLAPRKFPIFEATVGAEAATRPPLLTTSRLFGPIAPTSRLSLVIQREPASVTQTALLAELAPPIAL